MKKKTEPYTIYRPADFYGHLLDVSGGEAKVRDGFFLYKSEVLGFSYEIRRLVFAPGFELAFSHYALSDEVVLDYDLKYKGIEILAYWDEQTGKPVSVGYQTRFSQSDSDSYNVTMKLPESTGLCVNVYLDRSWLNDYINMERFQQQSNDNWCELRGNERSRFLAVIEQLQNHSFAEESGKIFLRAKAMELLSYILSFMDKEKGDPAKYPAGSLSESDITALYKVRGIIEDNFQNPPSINEISKCVYMSSNKLMHSYKQYFGVTIYNYIITCRMKHALNLIEKKAVTVSEAARESGYIHQGHFIKTFKNFYGITPGELKKNNN